MTAPKTYDELLKVWRDIMESAAESAARDIGERPTVVQNGGSFHMLWADGEITNEVEVERMQ